MESSDARAFHVSEYDIESKEHVGRGILGEIHRAKHKLWGPVWIKDMTLNSSVTTNAAKKLRKEAEILKNLRHKNIVQLMGMIWDNLQKHYALVFEPARYGILAEFMEMNLGLNFHLKLAFMSDAALGMSYLHSLRPPVIHRDLRWQHIQLHEHFVLKIADFGLAEWINYSRSHSNNRYSQAPTYHIAPECWKDINLKPSWRTDMYSFAVLCWTIAVQEEPYRYLVSAEQIRTAVIDGQRPSLDDLPVDCIPELREWLCTWWGQDPDGRPRFEQVASLLDDYTQQHADSIQEAKIQLYRGGAEDIATDGNESLREVPSFNFNACAAERVIKMHSQDLSGSDFGSQRETAVKRLGATAALEQNDLEEDADESPSGPEPQSLSYPYRLRQSHDVESSRKKSPDSSISAGGIQYVSSLASSGSFGKVPFPDWKMPNGNTIQSAGPTSLYEKTSENGKTCVYNFSSASNIQIGERNLMTVTTQGTTPKSKEAGRGAAKTPNSQGKKVTKYKITSSKQELDQKNIDMLTRELGKHWKELARKLHFSEGEIDSVEHDNNQYGLKEIILKFLCQWKEKMGDGATLCAIADALIEIKLYPVAAKLDDSSRHG